jgi:hypothetical protein
MTMTGKLIKGSPEYRVTTADGREIARAHCVHVDRGLYSIVIDGHFHAVTHHDKAFALLATLNPRETREGKPAETVVKMRDDFSEHTRGIAWVIDNWSTDNTVNPPRVVAWLVMRNDPSFRRSAYLEDLRTLDDQPLTRGGER